MADRRLPVYLLLDVSGSMDGEPIQAVNTGIQQLISDLNDSPEAVQQAYISVITFGDTAQQIVPLTKLTEFQVPELTADGLTALGPALSLLCECWDREAIPSTGEHTGDFRPLVFLMTDGEQNEGDFEKGVRDFKSHKWGAYALLAAGPEANISDLKKINPEAVYKMDTLTPGMLKKFFKWVSGSIKSQSKRNAVVEDAGEQSFSAFAPTPIGMELVDMGDNTEEP